MLNNPTIWAILGLALLGAEMLSATIYLMWFGISALIMAIIVWLAPNLSMPVQVVVYAVLSFASIFAWKHFKVADLPDSKVGQSTGEYTGKVGVVLLTITPLENGRIQFAQGIMGSREWAAIADETIAIGQKAEIVAVVGNRLKVRAI